MKHVLIALLLTGCTDAATSDDDVTPDASSGIDCSSSATTLDKAVCQATGFLASLSTSEKATANPAFTDVASRTKWSNLPTAMVPRAGIGMGELTASQQAAALELMGTVLGDTTDLTGIRAADQYLAENGGGDGYGAGLYYVAVFGTPSATGDWAIMFGGHHLAYNVSFAGGVAYPTPNHVAVEPKAEFELDDSTYEPLVDEGGSMISMFGALDTAQLATAKLSGQFSDVVVGPAEYGTGSSAAAKAKFPTGANRTGVLVASLTADQQALVAAAIEAWVSDFDSSISSALLDDYTTPSAYQDTYIAWAGTGSTPDVDTSGTYFRIDGPRVWIEVACQGGVIIRNATHYHTIYRDKANDYGNQL
jgi:hypothetical protein